MMVKIIAIETSASACSVALLLDDEIKQLHKEAPMQQAQLILSMLDELLSSANLTLNQFDAVAFGRGPGSFTGVRIATSVAQGLGYALSLPLIPISSLAATAQAAFDDLGWENLLVALDARIREIYWAAYTVNSKGTVELIENEIICTPQSIVIPPEGKWCGIGNAWEVYAESLPFRLPLIDGTRLPTAKAIAKLAKLNYEQQKWVFAEDALPVYLRDEVAVKEKKR